MTMPQDNHPSDQIPLHLRLHLFLLIAFSTCALIACGGQAGLNAAQLQQLAQAKPKYVGELKMDGLVPSSLYEETITHQDLGRSVQMKADRPALVPPTPCASLLPDRRREDYRDRVDQVFDIYLFQSIQSGQTSLSVPSLQHEITISSGHGAGEVVSAKVAFSRSLSFVNEDELKYYDQCCALTGSCGEKMIAKVYEVSRDVHYVSAQDQSLMTLLGDESLSDSSSATQLAEKVYQARAKQGKGEQSEAWTHLSYRALPEAIKPPLTEAAIEVLPAVDEIKCKTKKSKQSDVIQIDIDLTGIDGAQAGFGYHITTSKLWADLTMVDRKRRVKVSKNEIICVPGPDAFTSPDDRCPGHLAVTILPPTCESIKGDQQLKWSARFGVYAPGDESATIYHESASEVSTLVKDR